MKEQHLADGSTIRRCIYTPHSPRATAATLLLDANVDIPLAAQEVSQTFTNWTHSGAPVRLIVKACRSRTKAARLPPSRAEDSMSA
jgi:hypothetical protein